MKYPNLTELVKYHPYHISTFAGFANITVELLEKVLDGEEELQALETFQICKYTGVPCSVLFNHRLIILSKNNRKHRAMIDDLHKKLYEVWEYEKKGYQYAITYMRYGRIRLVNMQLDFQNGKTVTYCRYLGIKEEINQILGFIASEIQRNEPRGTTCSS